MNWIKKNRNWVVVVILGIIPLVNILSMIQLDFSSSADSWISMGSLSIPGHRQGEAARIVSGAHIAVRETGEWAVRWLMVILSLTPIAILTGIKSRLYVRQAAGIITFLYTALHLLFFCIDRNWIETFQEFGFVMGFIAAIIMAALAITSNRKSMRFMRKKWKKMHKTAYLAALLTIGHLVLLKHTTWAPYLLILLVGFVLRLNFVRSKIREWRSGKAVSIARA
ncbi:ferric reductase-like transmembrane domain-containing protein [Mangrovibacterium marinum]|uniref:Sulfoxide reductase heme-binding subunit YedZ n=1 Tax=Mangrovibacterium marinum TaxID=1639118 RepID=A0A2T5C1C7_9BACT|nr:ferric reductase-like transmembrane domain-containing protein [Mangrovibacterium marinum]PTN08476.1 sulfoxide reductase heme-binding subunit YedZ [Mangrovibacterium marinum]